MNMYAQAKVMCTYGTAAKTIIGLTLVSLVAQAVRFILMYFYDAPLNHMVGLYGVVLLLIVPLAVFVINVMVVCQVRRASSNAVANLGLLHPASNSAVPTVMLLSTSFIYILLTGPHCVLGIADLWMSDTSRCSDAWKATYQGYVAAWALMQPVYVYNFFVYVVTGQRFRSDLRQLLARCCCNERIPIRCCVSAAATDDILGEDFSINELRMTAVTGV